MKELIAAVRKHALDHYHTGGWDYVVEAFEDAELAEVIGDAATPEEAIARVGKVVGIAHDYHKDIQGEAF